MGREVWGANDDSPAIGRASVLIRWLAFATAILFAAMACFLLADNASAAELDGKVVRVHDGDTLTILINKRQIPVRLVEIDAPELHQAFGRRSQESLSGMCAGQQAHVVQQGHDRYKRVLGRVTCGGFDANTEQVRRGMAWVFVRYAPKHSPLYRLQPEARIEQRGLWNDPHAVPPWDYRARERAAQRNL
jgi:endonuclease YncB( thermonuclease family)